MIKQVISDRFQVEKLSTNVNIVKNNINFNINRFKNQQSREQKSLERTKISMATRNSSIYYIRRLFSRTKSDNKGKELQTKLEKFLL